MQDVPEFSVTAEDLEKNKRMSREERVKNKTKKNKQVYYLLAGFSMFTIILIFIGAVSFLNYESVSDGTSSGGLVVSVLDGGNFLEAQNTQKWNAGTAGNILETYINPEKIFLSNQIQTLNQSSEPVQNTTEEDDDQPADGACDESRTNGCSSGSLSTVSQNSSHYLWTCQGQNGGSDASCSKRKIIAFGGGGGDQSPPQTRNPAVDPAPVNGVCDESTNNGCSSGSLNDISDSSSHYLWTCEGSNGGSDDSCSRRKLSIAEDPVLVNGVCDESTNNGCSSGSLNDTSDNTSYYLWMCQGSDGGSDASCSKAKTPVNGACDETRTNGCSSGALRDTADTRTHYRWTCQGSNGGSDDSCWRSKSIVVSGVCDTSTVNRCISGILLDENDAESFYHWSCVGENGGPTDSCSKAKDIPIEIIEPVCGTEPHTCSAGTVFQPREFSTLYTWSCVGKRGHHPTYASCKILKIINGTCGNSSFSCSSGRFANLRDNHSHYMWKCNGFQGGTNSPMCTYPKPVDNRITFERTTDRLILNISATHFMFRYTLSVANSTVECDSSEAGNAYYWTQLFGPRGGPAAWSTRDSASYSIRGSGYLCALVVYSDESVSEGSKDYVYYGPYPFN